MKPLIGFITVAPLLFAGLPPRSNPSDYPVRADGENVTVAAQVLDDSQVQSGFATDLFRKYAVIEVAVYPKAGTTLDVADVDFGLKFDGKSGMTRAASPRTIAAAIQRSASKKKNDITLFPSVGVGVNQDPVYGTGTSTGVGVGVGVGDQRPQPASTADDRQTMRTELEEKGLPSGPVSKAVGGYLYFPLPQRKKVVVEELVFEHDGKTFHLSFK